MPSPNDVRLFPRTDGNSVRLGLPGAGGGTTVIDVAGAGSLIIEGFAPSLRIGIMAATVPVRPYALDRTGIASARPPRGGISQWGAVAELLNYSLGRGGVLIPGYCPGSSVAAGTTKTLRHRVWPRYAATHRVWDVQFTTTGAGGRVFGTFTDPSGGSANYSVGGLYLHRIIHYEKVAVRTASEVELAPTFSSNVASTKAVVLQSVACWEIPRVKLATDTNEFGTIIESCGVDSEILAAASGAGLSVGGVAEAVAQADSIAQRNGVAYFARDVADALSTTSAAYTPVFTAGSDAICLGRLQYRTSTVKTLEVRARCSAGAGTTGNLRFTMTSGASLVLPITIGMPSTWLSGTLDVDAEDLTTVDGRRATRNDKCLVEWQRTGGANNIFLEGYSLGKG